MEVKKNGGCSSCGSSASSCSKTNVFDWLAYTPENEFNNNSFVEVVFSDNIRKDFFNNSLKLNLKNGDWVVVPGNMVGYDIGTVSLTGYLASYQIKKKNINIAELEVKKILRLPNLTDLQNLKIKPEKEQEILVKSRMIIKSLNLEMKLSMVELQADFRKATFYFTSDDRVDFRELIKKLSSQFLLKIEMKQIGIRQEAGLVGGIGSCGRELCCSKWLKDFKSINTTAARYQNLSINKIKLSGQCGRLKCCLNYELDVYIEAVSMFPKNAQTIKTSLGIGRMVKKDILKRGMTYFFSDSGTYKVFSIDEIKEILEKNRNISNPVFNLESKDDKKQVKVSEKGHFNNVESLSIYDSKKKNNNKHKNSPNKPYNQQ